MKAVLFVAVALIVGVRLPAEAQQGPAAPNARASEPQQTGQHVNTDALTLKDFKNRIDKYLELHKRAAQAVPALKETNDPKSITTAQDALASRIRSERSSAQPGDIFTPAIRDNFRRLLSPQLKGEDGRDAKKVLKDDAPAGVPLKVNAKYPQGAALPTVPASLLLSLPTLPKEVEYRIVGQHLILRDTEADIIVDYIPNAVRQ
jgi:hypothetical protein